MLGTVNSENMLYASRISFWFNLFIILSNICNRIDPLHNFENYPLELKYRLQQASNDARNNLMVSKN